MPLLYNVVEYSIILLYRIAVYVAAFGAHYVYV
jgi:hypothetical protein